MFYVIIITFSFGKLWTLNIVKRLLLHTTSIIWRLLRRTMTCKAWMLLVHWTVWVAWRNIAVSRCCCIGNTKTGIEGLRHNGRRLRGQVHLHNCRIIGDSTVVNHTDVLYVAAAKQNVLVNLTLRWNWTESFSIFRSERLNWKKNFIFFSPSSMLVNARVKNPYTYRPLKQLYILADRPWTIALRIGYQPLK